MTTLLPAKSSPAKEEPAKSSKPEKPEGFKYDLGDFLTKTSGSRWTGRVVGFYSTELNPEGYAIESMWEKGSVQIYPVKALEPWTKDSKPYKF